MLKPGDFVFPGLLAWLLLSELRLELTTEGSVLLRSTEVFAVWRESGLVNVLELALEVVGVVEEMDQWRMELVRMGTCPSISPSFDIGGIDTRLLVR